jgi:hypothetical protein
MAFVPLNCLYCISGLICHQTRMHFLLNLESILLIMFSIISPASGADYSRVVR